MAQEKSTPPQFVVVDDHPMVLDGTFDAVQKQYPAAEIHKALTAKQTLALVSNLVNAGQQPDVVIVDLSIPDKMPAESSDQAQVTVGIELLRTLMAQFSTLNIMVQSAHVQSLVRLKPEITHHQGGFTIVDKSLPMDDMLAKLDWASKGVNFTPPEMRTGLEVKREWLKVLKLAFEEGLQDKAIAEQMNVAERTVRHYWSKLQDALGVYPNDEKKEGKNIRIRTEIRAREEGLID